MKKKKKKEKCQTGKLFKTNVHLSGLDAMNGGING